MTRPTYIASCSFGKDSIATILLALQHDEPLDRVVYVEVMWDNKRGISGEHPAHAEWIHGTAIPRLESMGVKIDVLRSEYDYLRQFNHILTRGKNIGEKAGYIMSGKCSICIYCKIKPIKEYHRQFDEYRQYVGIAIDEPVRLARCHAKGQISLLEKYGYTERMAKELCEENGLLSPIYQTANRGGCWFCPNVSHKVMAVFRKEYPALWSELYELRHEETAHNTFKYEMTIEQYAAKMDAYDAQMKIQF